MSWLYNTIDWLLTKELFNGGRHKSEILCTHLFLVATLKLVLACDSSWSVEFEMAPAMETSQL